MAADDNKIVVSIELDDGTIRRGFARIESEGKSSFQRIGETALGVFSANVITGSLNSLKSALGGLFEAAIKSSSESEASIQKLNSALAVSGGLTDGASAEFQALADRIQETTTVSDDTVLALETLAVTYTKTNAAALKLTQTSVDLAAVTGNDVNSTLQTLAATLSGQAGRLARLFPELKQFTSAQLQAGAAVDYFNNRFSGAAEKQSDTFSGRIIQLKNNFDDLLKLLGNLIVRSPSVVATIRAVSDAIVGITNGISRNVGNTDFFKDLLINLGLIIQASVETGRRIGLSFELAFERAKRAYLAFKVISTLGFSNAFNQDLLEANEEIARLKGAFSEDSVVTVFFDGLLAKLRETSGELKSLGGEGIKNNISKAIEPIQELDSSIESLGEAMGNFSLGFSDAISDVTSSSVKGLQEAGANAFRAFSNSVSSGFAAIGKALVKGEDVFQAFAGALLSGLGQAAIQMGSFYILLGIARTLSSYGFDSTAAGLIATGGALTVLGGALSAFGDGVTGTSNPATSVSTGGGSAISNGDSGDMTNPATDVQRPGAQVQVVIQGSIYDTAETGSRIIDLINDTFNANGARIVAT